MADVQDTCYMQQARTSSPCYGCTIHQVTNEACASCSQQTRPASSVWLGFTSCPDVRPAVRIRHACSSKDIVLHKGMPGMLQHIVYSSSGTHLSWRRSFHRAFESGDERARTDASLAWV